MERIARALELAHSQRTQANSAPNSAATVETDVVTAPGTTAVITPNVRLAPATQASDQPADSAPVLVAPTAHVDRSQPDAERILPPNASGPQAKSYKLLRTQVLQRLDQLGANSLAILSAAANEGKTLTAINLAISVAAELGRSALLVDFDLRRPSVHRRLGFEPSVGVETCLQQGRPAHEAIVRLSGYPRLSVLPARDAVEQSSELIASQRAAALVAELRSRYSDRVVIFDLPPVLESDDALAFSRIVQAGLFVIAEGRTEREEISRSLTLLQELPIVGTVLNGSREPQRSGY